MKTGIELIAEERKEQIEKHNRTIEFDVEFNQHQQLTYAAVELLSTANKPLGWDESTWNKMISKPYKERVIIAASLLAAELDRLNNLE